VRAEIRENIRTLCKYKGVEISEGRVCVDHVHICVKIPPKKSVSEFMGYPKGKSALMLYDKHPKQRSKWNKLFWARGYYVAIVGDITESVIRAYIREQAEKDRKEDRYGAAL
jgi:putative transposase